MLVKDINRESRFANPAANGAAGLGDDWFGTVLLHGNTVMDLAEADAPEMALASRDYPVQICGDFGMLAALCLAPAHAAFAAGDNLAGCRKVWNAAEFALSLVAESRGWPCQTQADHYDLLEHLQAEIGDREEIDLVAGYSLACSYRDGAEYGFLEDYVIKHGLPWVPRFIKELLARAQESA